MKKVLSFVLALAMILGCTSMAFATTADKTFKKAADYVEPFADAETNGMATILKDLGILNGDQDGLASLEKDITRAEMVTVIMRALGYEKLCQPTDTKFTDVKKAHWASGYIAMANSLNLADGRTKTSFAPDEKVTGDEAVAFVLKALGYDQAHLEGTWPTNYRAAAANLGLFSKIVSTPDPVDREYAFTVLFDALNLHLVQWNAKDEVFEVANKVYSGDANYATLLTKITGDNTKATLAAIYDTADKVLLAENTTFKNFADASKYYGKLVTVLYMDADDAPVGIYKVSSKTLEGSFTTDQLTTFKAIDGTLYTVADRSTVEAISDNNVWYATEKAITEVISDKDVTSKTALTIEVVLDPAKDTQIANWVSATKWTRTATVQVTSKQALAFDSTIVGTQAAALAGNEIATKKNAAGEVVLDNFVLVGVDKLSDIDEDAVVEVYSQGAARKYVVTQEVVTGKISRYNEKTDAYTVNGKVYPAAVDYVSKAGINDVPGVKAYAKAGTECAFFLNAAGEFAFGRPVVPVTPEKVYQYAFVLDATNKLEMTLDSDEKTIKSVTNYALRLLPLETMEEVTYNYSSKGALDNVIDGNENWEIASGCVIKYRLDDDAVVEILTEAGFVTNGAVGMTQAAAVATFNAVGFAFSDRTQNRLYAENVRIYKVGVSTKFPTQAAYYVEKTPADVNKATADGFFFNIDKNGKVDTVILFGQNDPAAPVAKITAAAFLGHDDDADGRYITVLLPDNEVEEYYVTGDALNFTAGYTSLYSLTFTGDKVTSIVALEVECNFTSATGLKLDGDVLKIGAGYEVARLYNATFFIYNEDPEVDCLEIVTDVDKINEALANVDNIDLYITEGYYVDAVVLYN